MASEDKQVGWKVLILDFMERYFYLICFATYALQEGAGGYERSFSSWMDEHKELRIMIGEYYLSFARISFLSYINALLLQIRARTSWSGTGRWTLPSWST